MSSPVTLHPPLSAPEVRDHPGIDGPVINSAAVIMIARKGETPQARQLYRLWLDEFRALEGQPLSQTQRESTALIAAMQRFGVQLTYLPGDDAG